VLLFEIRQDDMCPAQITDQIRLHDLLVRIHWRLVEGPDSTDPGVIDPDIDTPAAKLGRRAGQLLDRIAERHVGGHHQRLGPQSAAFIGHFVQRFLVARCQDHSGLLTRKRLCCCAADAAGGASDDHHHAVESGLAHVRFSGLLSVIS